MPGDDDECVFVIFFMTFILEVYLTADCYLHFLQKLPIHSEDVPFQA